MQIYHAIYVYIRIYKYMYTMTSISGSCTVYMSVDIDMYCKFYYINRCWAEC